MPTPSNRVLRPLRAQVFSPNANSSLHGLHDGCRRDKRAIAPGTTGCGAPPVCPRKLGPVQVLFATAELSPVARVGGLAEAASGLVRALRLAGTTVDVVMPDYEGIDLADEEILDVVTPEWVGPCSARTGLHPTAGRLILVDVPGMKRPHPYVDDTGQGWPDNDRRFMAFSAVVAALVDRTQPDVVHLNDWHTSAALGMMTDRPPVVLTIHTLGYQGVTGPEWMEHLHVGRENFEWYGDTNPLAGAVNLTDRLIAVSPNYAKEIVQPESGMGLDERLLARGGDLIGIRNGIDNDTWNPSVDPLIPTKFSLSSMDGRDECRAALRSRSGWPMDTTPVIGVVSRLVDQKGIDLLLEAVRFLPTMSARLLVLGAGDAAVASRLREAADTTPSHVWFHDGYDEELAHWIFAGSDLFAMPSRFEPCGLAQMQAMAYGSIPIVTEVGGLVDTVLDADQHRTTGTGFTTAVDVPSLVDGLHRAVRAWRHGTRRKSIQRRGMEIDWSWTDPAGHHLDIYRQVIAEA